MVSVASNSWNILEAFGIELFCFSIVYSLCRFLGLTLLFYAKSFSIPSTCFPSLHIVVWVIEVLQLHGRWNLSLFSWLFIGWFGEEYRTERSCCHLKPASLQLVFVSLSFTFFFTWTLYPSHLNIFRPLNEAWSPILCVLVWVRSSFFFICLINFYMSISAQFSTLRRINFCLHPLRLI